MSSEPSADRLLVSLLVDNQTPVPAVRRSGSKILEIKCEDRKIMALGISHERGIDETQI